MDLKLFLINSIAGSNGAAPYAIAVYGAVF